MLSRRPVHHHATQYLPCSYNLGSKCDDSTLLTNCTQARALPHSHECWCFTDWEDHRTTVCSVTIWLSSPHLLLTWYKGGIPKKVMFVNSPSRLWQSSIQCNHRSAHCWIVQWGEMYTCEKWRQDTHHQLYHLHEFQFCRNSQVRLCCLMPLLWLG